MSQEADMEDPRPAPEQPPEAPFFQRLYDRPFVLLALSLIVMVTLFTFWGLWEITHLPTATLP